MTQELPFLDPKQPWYPGPISPRLAQMLHAKLTGKRQDDGSSFTSFVKLSDQLADKLIANLRKDPRGYPQMDDAGGHPVRFMDNLKAYQEWLVSEYLPKSTGTESIQNNKINLAGAPAPTRPMPHGEGQGPLPSVEIKKEEPEDEVEDDEIVEAVEEVVEEKNEREEEIKEKIREGVSPEIADTLTKFVNKSTGSKISTYKDDRESFKGDAKSVTNTVILDALISQFSSIKRSLDSVDAKLSEQNILIRASLGEAVNSLDSLESNSGTESKLDEIIAAYKAQDKKNEEARDQAETDASIAKLKEQSDNEGTEGFTPGGTGGLLGRLMDGLFKQVMKFFRRGYKKLLRGVYRKLPKSWRSKIRGVTRGVRTARNALKPANLVKGAGNAISKALPAVDNFKKSGGFRGLAKRGFRKGLDFLTKHGRGAFAWADKFVRNQLGNVDNIIGGIKSRGAKWAQQIGGSLDNMNPMKLGERVKGLLRGQIDDILKSNNLVKQVFDVAKNPKRIGDILKSAATNKHVLKLREGLKVAKKMKIGGIDKVIAAIMGVIDYGLLGESPVNAILRALGGLLGYTAGFAIGAPFGGAPGFVTGMAGAFVGEQAARLLAKGLVHVPTPWGKLGTLDDPIANATGLSPRKIVRDPDDTVMNDKLNKDQQKLAEEREEKEKVVPSTPPTAVQPQLDKPETPGELEKGGLVPYEMGGMHPTNEMLTASAGTLVGASRDFLDQAGPAADGVDIMFKEKAAKLQKTFKFPSTLAKTNVGGSFSGIRQINDVFSNQGVTYNEEQVKEMMKKMMGGSKPDPDGGNGGGNGGGDGGGGGVDLGSSMRAGETIQTQSNTGSGGFIQGGSGLGSEGGQNTSEGYATHYHLSPPSNDAAGWAQARSIAQTSTQMMLSRGSSVYFGNIKEYARQETLADQIAREQQAHTRPGRTQGGIDMQEKNNGSMRMKFPLKVTNVTDNISGGSGRTARIVGTNVTLAHGASGSANSIEPNVTPIASNTTSPAASIISPTPTNAGSNQNLYNPTATQQQTSANSVFFVPGQQPFLPLPNASTPSIVHVSGINARQMRNWMNYR